MSRTATKRQQPNQYTKDADGLTEKMRRFVQAYLKEPNATQAAITAGYKMKTADRVGSQLLAKTRVAAAISAARAERAKRARLDADWVIRKLRREATRPDHQGGSSRDRIRALHEIGLHLGMALNRSTTNNVTVNVAELSHEERLAKIEAIMQLAQQRLSQSTTVLQLPAPKEATP